MVLSAVFHSERDLCKNVLKKWVTLLSFVRVLRNLAIVSENMLKRLRKTVIHNTQYRYVKDQLFVLYYVVFHNCLNTFI